MGALALGVGLGPLARAAFGKGDDLLVVVFLRGGCDGLNLVAPVSDPGYGPARGVPLRVGESGARRGLALANGLAGTEFLLHARARELHGLYADGKLAIVHAVGLTHQTRSHFEAQALVERGVADFGGVRDGWLKRLARELGLARFGAISASGLEPESFLGLASALTVSQPEDFQLSDDGGIEGLLERLLVGEGAIAAAGRETLAAVRQVRQHLARGSDGQVKAYKPSVPYPGETYDEFRGALLSIAELAKMQVGMRLATVDLDGWDTHQDQADRFSELVARLSGQLAAFLEDLGSYPGRVTVLVMSEFGRRVKSNDSGGTDHGHGGSWLLLGNAVNGGRMYGRWPGLATEQLDHGLDLAVTTDYRTVLAELIGHLAGPEAVGRVLPGFEVPAPLGLLG